MNQCSLRAARAQSQHPVEQSLVMAALYLQRTESLIISWLIEFLDMPWNHA